LGVGDPFGALEIGTQWKIEAGDTEKINAGRAGMREGQTKPPCAKHSKPPASSSSTRTAAAQVYGCEYPGKKGHTDKAIRQCCSINDAFCLTEAAGCDTQIFAHKTVAMPQLETNRNKVVARLARDGWVGRHGGDHDVYKHPARPGRIVVPRHRTLSPGVARVIAKVAGWLDP
jgi:predicted RNA binding protein YcfA (HicA-like mRNA interferase family)